MRRLTKLQISLLKGELIKDRFILLSTPGEDRVAKNLHNMGLGRFVDFRIHYSWRNRFEYFNHFCPNDKGRAIIRDIKNGNY